MNRIQSEISSGYNNYKQFKIKFILSYDVLLRFVSTGSGSDTEWKFVYHGTDCKNDEGIINKGLIVGGTRGVRQAHGAAYGRGIYCSPSSSTARGYEKGSMFVCIVRYKQVKTSGNIWVCPNEKDILPLYLVSFSSKTGNNGVTKTKPQFPYFPIPAALQSILAPTTTTTEPDDGLSQQIIKFIPSFTD
eukprot:TRINITY_DN6480_c1_g1_i1.p1 TRINITY_DN6480_c1_g1~~TRINITY_DN6480_c1_g1_i1.p1  ORF type:complete len:189 (-),score=13.47 TRINITY_DN6480_c1_g1_i1:305-871(-)